MSNLVSFISSKALIAKFIDFTNIQEAGYLNRAKEWIPDICNEIELSSFYEEVSCESTITNYRGKLPCDARYLLGMLWNGCEINLKNAFTHSNNGITIYNKNSTTIKLNPAYYTTSFEEGIIDTYYLRIPQDCDGNFYIPNDPLLIEALMWGILRRLIIRGYKHPLFNFQSVHELFKEYKGKARNSVNHMSNMDWKRYRDNMNILTFDDYNFNNRVLNEY